MKLSFRLYLLICIISSIGYTRGVTGSETPVKLLLTTNLQGRFTAETQDQDLKDPMLRMAQSLLQAQYMRDVDMYLDLGNSFSQGLLSRFSHGSLMMEYLENLGCTATLVSSHDVKVGIGNLDFLHKGKKTQLLSANILENGKPLFTPHFIRTIEDKKIAVIGLTSRKAQLDIAEKQLMDAALEDADTALEASLAEIRKASVDIVILLSGLSARENIRLLETHADIAFCISGGDADGRLYRSRASRVDLVSGQSLISLTNPEQYYELTFSAGKTVSRLKLNPQDPLAVPAMTQRPAYLNLAQRLCLWKNRFSAMGAEIVAEKIPPSVEIDTGRVAQLLLHRHNAEIAVIEKNAVTPRTLSGQVTYFDILNIINNELPVYTYQLSGKSLKRALKYLTDVSTAGSDGLQVQGYPIENHRMYRIASTQSVYENLIKRVKRKLPYHNTWQSLSDNIRSDLQTERVIFRPEFDYLERRLRTLVDIDFYNFYEQADVSKGSTISTPPGRPSKSYGKWGMENKVDVTIYNRYHSLVITPYMYVVKQDDIYQQNLLRGTVFYTYNSTPEMKPYFKSQLDTVVRELEDQYPLLFRETVGAFFQYPHVSGKLGIGIEKQTQDPEKDLITGFESILDARFEVVQNLTYVLNMDVFYGFRRLYLSQNQTRLEVNNALVFKLNSFLGVSLKHKWFFLDSLEHDERYSDSRIILGFDVATDFKFY